MHGPTGYAPVMPSPPGRQISPIWIVAVVVALVLVGVGIFVAVKATNDAEDTKEDIEQTIPEVTDITLPDGVTVPEITVPEITLPEAVTVPEVTLPEGVTIPEITVPKITVPKITIPDITIPDDHHPGHHHPGHHVPDNPVTPGQLPGGARSLFDQPATGAVVGDLEQYLPGDPTKFTSVILYPDYAVVSAQDPGDPENTVGAMWRAGRVTGFPGIPAFDIDTHTFTTADVNWDAVSGAVAQAPALLGADEVTHVIVERWDFEPDLPVRILVYAGDGYVEVAADGTIIGTH